jgi:DNA-directed RNA polymerase subunit RPC12/RpoP
MIILSKDIEKPFLANKITDKLCCHHCGSNDYNKRGKDKDKQDYTCKKCGRNFREIYQSDIKDKNIKCHHCNSSNYQRKGKSFCVMTVIEVLENGTKSACMTEP